MEATFSRWIFRWVHWTCADFLFLCFLLLCTHSARSLLGGSLRDVMFQELSYNPDGSIVAMDP